MKIVSLNIEGQRHLSRVREFLMKENADVVCLMEVFEDTLPDLTVGYPYVEFAPGYLADQDAEGVIAGERKWGELMMSHYSIEHVRKIYLGSYGETQLPLHGVDTHTPVLIVGEVVVAQKRYGVATVHGTWTKGGVVSLRQRREMGKMRSELAGWEGVIAGDFNIPRGNAMYQELAKQWHDNIPREVETTLDPILHYANKDEVGRLKLVVDYVWSTPKYQVRNVSVKCGISDHCAVIAEVLRLD